MTAPLDHWFPKNHRVPFVEFMQQALYHPQYGYYTGQLTKLGREGDFITAPELTPLFGQCLAQACIPFFEKMSEPVLFEFGAGTGQLCIDLLRQLEQMNALPKTYRILEVSGHLKIIQQQRIREHLPHLFDRIEWLSAWPEVPFEGMVIANEVLDAMPVHRLKQEEGKIYESFIERTLTGEFVEQWQPCENPRLIEQVQKYFPKQPMAYVSEVNGLIQGWLSGCYHMLRQGAVLLIDYGFPAHEYYHSDRNMGTLICHYRHHSHPDFLTHVGKQDITAHVNFTDIAENAADLGFHVAYYTNQASFLLTLGILEKLPCAQALFQAQQATKILLHPSEMGELFKVILLTKAWENALPWSFDKRASL